MKTEEDSITHFYRQKLVDYTLDTINPKYRWTVFVVIVLGLVGFFFKGVSALWLTGGLIVAASIFRRLKMQEATLEMAMEEIRYRINDTNSKIVDAHTSLGYIYGERLGVTSEEGFNPLVFLWKRKGLIHNED